jgi:hypothetical protein
VGKLVGLDDELPEEIAQDGDDEVPADTQELDDEERKRSSERKPEPEA